MNGVRLQFDREGNTVDTSLEKAMTQETPASAPAPKQQGKMRGRFDESTGQFIVEENRPTEYRATPVESQGITVRSNAGPITLAQATGQDIINVPALGGETSVAVAASMGYVQPRAGGGFELTALAQPQQKQTDATKKPAEKQPKQDDEPGDASNVPGTSQEVDSLQTDLAKRSPAGFDGLITSLVRTGEMPAALVEDLARQSGQDSAEFTANVQRMTNEYVAAGRAALANTGVSAPEVFEQWARANQPEAFDSAVRDLVTSKSVARMQDLGRTFVAANNEKLASLIQSHGVDTEVRDGQVYVSRRSLGLPPTPKVGDFGGSDSILLRDAIRAGHVTINQ